MFCKNLYCRPQGGNIVERVLCLHGGIYQVWSDLANIKEKATWFQVFFVFSEKISAFLFLTTSGHFLPSSQSIASVLNLDQSACFKESIENVAPIPHVVESDFTSCASNMLKKNYHLLFISIFKMCEYFYSKWTRVSFRKQPLKWFCKMVFLRKAILEVARWYMQFKSLKNTFKKVHF